LASRLHCELGERYPVLHILVALLGSALAVTDPATSRESRSIAAAVAEALQARSARDDDAFEKQLAALDPAVAAEH
jgi:hypothetical protein